MRILLIEPPFYLFQDIRPGSASFGLGMLAAMANKEGHEVKVFSPDFEITTKGRKESVITKYENVSEKINTVKNRLEGIINSFQPEVIGISLWTATVKVALELAAYIKGIDSDIPIVAGGIHATILPEEVLKNVAIDFVIKGEGEFAFVSLLESIGRGNDPKKERIDCLSFLDERGRLIQNPVKYCQNLDELPFPGYEHFINFEKFSSNAFRSVMFSRGCPFRCSYCASHMLWTRKPRSHSPSYIVKMVKHIHQKFGTTYFRFDDDTFTLRRNLVLEICQLIKQEQMPIKWHCDTRVDLVTHELLSEMKDAGLDTIAMGIESGDAEIRKMMRKTSSLEATRKAFKIASEVGIKTRGYFMIGFPGETYEQASRTLDFLEEIQPTFPCISICIPYPGTEAFQIAVKMGVIKNADFLDWSSWYHHSNINFSGRINRKEWEKLMERCTKNESQAARRVEREKIERIVEQITISKLIHRYKTKPYAIFWDFYRLFRIFWRSIKNMFAF